jgi:hypothetical protein
VVKTPSTFAVGMHLETLCECNAFKQVQNCFVALTAIRFTGKVYFSSVMSVK